MLPQFPLTVYQQILLVLGCTNASPMEASPCGWNCMVCPTMFGNFVISAVIQSFHRVEDTSLDRFQTIIDVRYGTFQYYVRGIVQNQFWYIPLSWCFTPVFWYRQVYSPSVRSPAWGYFFVLFLFINKIVAHIYLNSLMFWYARKIRLLLKKSFILHIISPFIKGWKQEKQQKV